MTFIEVAAGYRVVVNLEEQEMLNKIGEDTLPYSELSERERYIADSMVSNGILYRKKTDKGFVLVANSVNDIPGYR